MSGEQAELDKVSGTIFVLCAANTTFHSWALPATWLSPSTHSLTSTTILLLTRCFSGTRQQLCCHPRLLIISSSHSSNSDNTSHAQFIDCFKDTCSYSTDLDSQWDDLQLPPQYDCCSTPLSPCGSAGLRGTFLSGCELTLVHF